MDNVVQIKSVYNNKFLEFLGENKFYLEKIQDNQQNQYKIRTYKNKQIVQKNIFKIKNLENQEQNCHYSQNILFACKNSRFIKTDENQAKLQTVNENEKYLTFKIKAKHEGWIGFFDKNFETGVPRFCGKEQKLGVLIGGWDNNQSGIYRNDVFEFLIATPQILDQNQFKEFTLVIKNNQQISLYQGNDYKNTDNQLFSYNIDEDKEKEPLKDLLYVGFMVRMEPYGYWKFPLENQKNQQEFILNQDKLENDEIFEFNYLQETENIQIQKNKYEFDGEIQKLFKQCLSSQIQILQIIGKGHLGDVYKVKDIVNNIEKAMKIIDKQQVQVESWRQTALKKEFECQKLAKGSFVQPMYLAFETNQKYCFITDIYELGDLTWNFPIQQKTQHLIQDKFQAKIFCAALVQGLSDFQEQNICHLDLHPLNICLDRHGYPIICDFGCSQIGISEWNQGGVDYMVGWPGTQIPELKNKTENFGLAADWYIIGHFIYSLFNEHIFSEKSGEPYLKNENCKLDDITRDIVQGLTNQDPEQRLGKNGVNEIKNHKFFENINWEKLKNKEYKFDLEVKYQNNKQKQNEALNQYQIYHEQKQF